MDTRARVIVVFILLAFTACSFNRDPIVIENETPATSKPEPKEEIEIIEDELAEPDQEKQEVETKTEVSEEEANQANDNQTVRARFITPTSADKTDLVSWGYEKKSDRKIDTIVIHSSYDALGDEPYDYKGLVAEYKQYGVAPHYLIDRAGKVYQLVEDKNIAYHAGQSKVPDGRTGANYFSIGIEMMNTKTDKYTKDQYKALNNLLESLKSKYKIKYVLGHDDIAPGRKTDPWNFDWDEIGGKVD